jgi:hypothetical protein
MFNRHSNTHPHSEITSAPPPLPSSGANTYPPEKKDSSRAEMGLASNVNDPERTGDMETDSGLDPKARDGVTVDAVWGRIDANGPNYRNLGWYVRLRRCHGR